MYFENEPVDLFPEVESPETGSNNPVNEASADRTSRLAALAGLGASEQAGSIFDTLQERADLYKSKIEQFGDQDVRLEASSRLQESKLRALSDVIKEALPEGDQELTAGAVQAYTNLAAMDVQEDASYALEQQAVERIQNLAAMGDTTQARVLLGNLERGNALDVIRDINAKRMILDNMIDKAQVAVEDQGILRHVSDFLLGFIPLNASLSAGGNVEIEKGLKNWYDGVLSGQRLRREADSLWDMPISEFSKFVNEDFIKNLNNNSTLLGYKNNTEYLNLLTQLGDRTSEAWVTNSFNAVDNFGFIPFTKIGKSALGMTGALVRNGARREASELTAKAALDVLQDSTEAAARSGVSVDEVKQALSVKAVNPDGSELSVGIATDADAALERGKALLAMRPQLEATARLNPDEVNHAVSVVTQRLERQFGREIKDVDVVSQPLSDGTQTNRVAFTLGKKSGGGFATEAQANRYLGSIGESGVAQVDESGQWFARVEIDMPETGFYTNLLNVKTPSPMRFVLGSRNVGDIDLANAAQVAGNKQAALMRTLVEPYQKTFRSLSRTEKESIGQVLQAGEGLGKWFNDDQIETLYQRRWNRAPTRRELEAYQAARDINDIEFALRNDDIYKQRVTRGYRTVSFELPNRGSVERVNAIIDRELKEIPKNRVYDVSTDTHYTRGNPLTPAMWERLKSQGYMLVNTEVPETLGDGSKVKQFLMKGNHVSVENLRRDQVAYRPGGHRMYRGKYFVKQTVRGVQPDTMEEFLDNPNTFIVAETRAEARKWADTMEAARLAYIRNEGLDVIDEILGGFPNMPDAEEFARLIEEGKIAKNTKIDVYFDREMPEEYLSDGQTMKFFDEDETGFNGFLRTTGRMYTGRKGDHLPDYMGNSAPTLDPFQTIDKSLMNISSLSSFSDFKQEAVERWMSTFGKELDVRDIPEDASRMKLFMEAPLKKGGNLTQQRVRNAALAQRDIIKRNLNWKTERDLAGEQWNRRIGDWVAGSRVDGVIPDVRKRAAQWWQDSNPVSALRGFAFDLKLGLFNIAQLPLQISTAVAATTMSPKAGMQGWAMIGPMRFMMGARNLSKEAFENRMDELVKRGVHELGGFKDAKEFKAFTRSAVNSGFFDVGGNHALLDYYGPSAAMDGFQSGVSRLRDAGRFAFFEAERWNRIVAWRIGWDEVVGRGLKPGTPEFNKALAGRSEEFAMNMSRESQAYWQRGILSIPTQFWAYNARMLEAMTVGNFTTAQKLRLIAGQSLLAGSAGIPGAALVSEMLKGQTGETPNMDSTDPLEKSLAVLDRGLLDTAIYHMTGADVLAGRRWGTGTWLGDTVQDIFGMSQYGETSAAELLGGATFSILGQTGKTLQPVIEYMTAESGDESRPLGPDALRRVALNVSSISNLLKAEMVYNYGMYVSNSGSVQVDNLPSQTSFAVAIGIQPAEMAELATAKAKTDRTNKTVKEAAKVIRDYRTKMLNQPDQVETLSEEVNAFVRLLPADIRQRALAQAHGQIQPSMYASYMARLEKENNGSPD